MSHRDGPRWKCRCGRETHRPEYVNGLLLCSECSFDEQYGKYRPGKRRIDPQDFYRPTFAVKKVS